jgi:hypothetical protein
MEGENYVNRELKYMLDPIRSRRKWIILYAALIVGLLAGFYLMVGRLRTHTLPHGQIELSVPYSKYLLGETVNFTVTNNFNSPVYAINNCPSEPLGIYRLDGNTWTRVRDKANKTCTADDRRVSIPAHGSMTVSLAPWTHLFEKPGKYRAVLLVEYYNSLPYQEFEVITAPPKATPPASSPSRPRQNNDDDSDEESSESDEARAPVTHTIHVNRSGIYDVTNLSLKVGDSVKIVYSAPIGDEIITRFSGTPAIGSLKLDHDIISGTRTFSSSGTWTFKADDRGGNTGVIYVS